MAFQTDTNTHAHNRVTGTTTMSPRTEPVFRTAKLSEADWKALDRALRAEAIVLLDELDALD